MERNTWEAAALLRTHMRVEAALASATAAVEAHGPAHGSARVAQAEAAEVADGRTPAGAPPKPAAASGPGTGRTVG